MIKKILVFGLPGSGKTTLAAALAKRLNAVHFNADTIRHNLDDWDFSPHGRNRQAKRMSVLCDIVNVSGHHAIADFVCPTADLRETFNANFTIFCDTIKPDQCRFPDTAKIFEPPKKADFTITRRDAEHYADQITLAIDPFDWLKPTAMFVGRYQPFHDGHAWIIRHGIEQTGQAIIAVRRRRPSASDPFMFPEIRDRITARLLKDNIDRSRFHVIPVPNIAAVMYGRDVGYSITRIDVPAEIAAISASAIRANGA